MFLFAVLDVFGTSMEPILDEGAGFSGCASLKRDVLSVEVEVIVVLASRERESCHALIQTSQANLLSPVWEKTIKY
jgi:hypothetical protein